MSTVKAIFYYHFSKDIPSSHKLQGVCLDLKYYYDLRLDSDFDFVHASEKMEHQAFYAIYQSAQFTIELFNDAKKKLQAQRRKVQICCNNRKMPAPLLRAYLEHMDKVRQCSARSEELAECAILFCNGTFGPFVQFGGLEPYLLPSKLTSPFDRDHQALFERFLTYHLIPLIECHDQGRWRY